MPGRAAADEHGVYPTSDGSPSTATLPRALQLYAVRRLAGNVPQFIYYDSNGKELARENYEGMSAHEIANALGSHGIRAEQLKLPTEAHTEL